MVAADVSLVEERDREPTVEWVENEPSLAEQVADEELLDGLGVVAFGVGVGLAANGNPSSGFKWAAAGLAAIGGRRTLNHYFQNQL